MKLFLVVCTRLYNRLCPSVGWSVGRLVGRSVGWSHFTFFYDLISLTSLLLPKWSGDLKYGPCPPARDFGSRVSGLVTLMFFYMHPPCMQLHAACCMQLHAACCMQLHAACCTKQSAVTRNNVHLHAITCIYTRSHMQRLPLTPNTF